VGKKSDWIYPYHRPIKRKGTREGKIKKKRGGYHEETETTKNQSPKNSTRGPALGISGGGVFGGGMFSAGGLYNPKEFQVTIPHQTVAFRKEGNEGIRNGEPKNGSDPRKQEAPQKKPIMSAENDFCYRRRRESRIKEPCEVFKKKKRRGSYIHVVDDARHSW